MDVLAERIGRNEARIEGIESSLKEILTLLRTERSAGPQHNNSNINSIPQEVHVPHHAHACNLPAPAALNTLPMTSSNDALCDMSTSHARFLSTVATHRDVIGRARGLSMVAAQQSRAPSAGPLIPPIASAEQPVYKWGRGGYTASLPLAGAAAASQEPSKPRQRQGSVAEKEMMFISGSDAEDAEEGTGQYQPPHVAGSAACASEESNGFPSQHTQRARVLSSGGGFAVGIQGRNSRRHSGPAFEVRPDGTHQMPTRRPKALRESNANKSGSNGGVTSDDYISLGAFSASSTMTATTNKKSTHAFDVIRPSIDGDPRRLLTKDYWKDVWAWLCTFPTLEAKHFIVIILDIVYVLGTTVISILVLSLFTASVFDRVPMSTADWKQDASLILPFELFFCAWMPSRLFVRVRLHHWDVLDTVPAITAHYLKSGWLWFDIFVTIPWGLPYYFGLISDTVFSILTVVHLARWLRCFRLNYSSHPLQPSKLGFRLFVTFCAIISGVHTLAVMFPVMDDRPHTEYSYLDCLYYIVVTMVTVGYGDITPKHEVGKGFAIFIIVLGVACVSLFTAALTGYLNRTDDWKYELEGKRKMLRKMLNHYEIPWNVQKQMMIRVPEAHQAQKNVQFLETMSSFPGAVLDKVKLYVLAKSLHLSVHILQDESMRALMAEGSDDEADSVGSDGGASSRNLGRSFGGDSSLCSARYASGVLRRGPDQSNAIHMIAPNSFFGQLKYRWTSRHTEVYVAPSFKSKEFPITLELAARMKPHYMDASEIIFQCGDIGHSMYFVMSGVVEISAVAANPPNTRGSMGGGFSGGGEGQKLSRCVKAMEFFGESALLDTTVRTARAKCVTACEIYSLHYSDVRALASTYPWLQERLAEELMMVNQAVKRSALYAMAVRGREESTAVGSTVGYGEASRPLGAGNGAGSENACVEALRAFNGDEGSRLDRFHARGSGALPPGLTLDPSRPLSSADLNPFARAVLDRTQSVHILVDIPLTAFEELDPQ